MSNDEELAERILEAGERSGEIVWRLPLHEEYDELIKGTFGDLNNAPEARKAGHDRGRRVPAEVRRRGAVGAPRHRRLGLGAGTPVRRARGPPATACACWSSWPAPTAPEDRADGLRAVPRPRADQAHRARVRRGRGRPGGRGARPHEVVPVRDRAQAGRAEPDGDPLPRPSTAAPAATRSPTCWRSRSSRGWTPRWRSRCAPTPRSGPSRVYLFGERGPEARVDAAAVLGGGAGGVRPDRARGRLGRRQHPHAGAPAGRRMGDRRLQAVHHQRRHRHLRDRVHHGRHRRGRRRRQGDLEHHRRQRHPRLRAGTSPTARWAGTRPTPGR